MRKLLLFIFCFLWLLSGFAQTTKEINNVESKDFPFVSFYIKSDNPVAQPKESLSISEEGIQVASTNITEFTAVGPAHPIPQNKNILFLWDMQCGQSEFIQTLLADLLYKMQTSDNLKANVAAFGTDANEKLTYSRLLPSFTNDLSELKDSVNIRKIAKATPSSYILEALDSAIMQIKDQTGAKAIVLFTKGNDNSDVERYKLIDKAKKNRILIHVMNIASGAKQESFCKNISSSTYGLCYISEGSFASAKESNEENFLFEENDTINAWVNGLAERWAGKAYKVSYKSSFEKDGQLKEMNVELGESVMESFKGRYNVPKYTFGDWIKDHLVLFIILLVVLVAGIATGLFFLIRYLRDVAADKREEKQKLEAERKRLKSEQENLKRKLEIAENEKRKQLEQEKAKEKANQRQEQLNALNMLMRSRNIKVRLLISTMTGSFEYMINTAENKIGSADDNDIVVVDPTVSRHHAVLYFDGQAFGIRDLRSTNGIMMNGFKINDVKLRNGDSVSLGKVVMKIYF